MAYYNKKEALQKIILNQVPDQEYIPTPCKVVEVDKEKCLLKLQSLINKTQFFNNIYLWNIGMDINYEYLKDKEGILFFTPYFIQNFLNKGDFEGDNTKTDGRSFGVFIPVLDKENKTNIRDEVLEDTSDLCIYNQSKKNKIVLGKEDKLEVVTENGSIIIEEGNINIESKSGEIVINSSKPLEIKNSSANLKEVLSEIVNLLPLVGVPTCAAPGSPAVINPQVTAKVPQIVTKINSLLK